MGKKWVQNRRSLMCKYNPKFFCLADSMYEFELKYFAFYVICTFEMELSECKSHILVILYGCAGCLCSPS